MKLLILFLFLTGCAGGLEYMNPNQATGVGAVGGAVAVKTVEKIKEVFTPKYPLYLPPHEICDISGSVVVTCYLIPCKDDCVRSVGLDEWFKNNPKVLTVRQSSVPAAISFCSKNEEACEIQMGKYAGETIVIIED